MHPHLHICIHTLATQVSFAKMAQSLDNTSSEALNTLVQSLAAKVDAALAPLTRLKWGEMEEVGDQSAYVNAVQAALDAAAKAGGGVAWLPANGTFMFGAGVAAFGHGYDGVTLRIDGAVTVPKPSPRAAGVWPACAPGWGGGTNGTLPVCYMVEAYNVDGFTLTSGAGPAILSGFLCNIVMLSGFVCCPSR